MKRERDKVLIRMVEKVCPADFKCSERVLDKLETICNVLGVFGNQPESKNCEVNTFSIKIGAQIIRVKGWHCQLENIYAELYDVLFRKKFRVRINYMRWNVVLMKESDIIGLACDLINFAQLLISDGAVDMFTLRFHRKMLTTETLTFWEHCKETLSSYVVELGTLMEHVDFNPFAIVYDGLTYMPDLCISLDNTGGLTMDILYEADIPSVVLPSECPQSATDIQHKIDMFKRALVPLKTLELLKFLLSVMLMLCGLLLLSLPAFSRFSEIVRLILFAITRSVCLLFREQAKRIIVDSILTRKRLVEHKSWCLTDEFVGESNNYVWGTTEKAYKRVKNWVMFKCQLYYVMGLLQSPVDYYVWCCHKIRQCSPQEVLLLHTRITSRGYDFVHPYAHYNIGRTWANDTVEKTGQMSWLCDGILSTEFKNREQRA